MRDGTSQATNALEWALVALAILIHLPFLTEYGWFRDELYYVASTYELGWGYVDHPPLSILVLSAWTTLFGESLVAVRLLPPLLGAGAVWLTGRLTAELGGGIQARLLAMVAALFAPTFLFLFHVYSMNGLDALVWTAAALLLARMLAGRPSLRDWLGLGLLLGVGLLNKISVLWLGAGLGAALLFVERERLRRPGPWLAGGLSLLIFSPYVIWNALNGWPTAEFMANAMNLKMVALAPLTFLGEVGLRMGPGAIPLALIGLGWLLIAPTARPRRALGVIFLAVLAILLIAGSSRPSYLAPGFPILFAAGGVAVERAGRVRRWLPVAFAVPVVAVGLAIVPMGLPVLPQETFVAYSNALGMAPASLERHEAGALPQHFADMHGWEELVDAVATATAELTPEERASAIVFGQNYGEAGAVDVLGRARDLPPGASGHNHYWFWGTRGVVVEVVIVIGGDRDDLEAAFESVEAAAVSDCRWCMPYEDDLTIWIARRPRGPLDEIWPGLRHFD